MQWARRVISVALGRDTGDDQIVINNRLLLESKWYTVNGNKTSWTGELLLCICVTCSILLLQMQRDERCAEG